jgi:hypothetical protein
MSHHGSDGEHQRAMSDAMKKLMGEYPDGRMNPDDAGAVAMTVGVEDSRVVMHFPKAVAWIGFTGDEAMELAQTLMKHARRAGLTHPVVIRIGE